MPPRKKNGQFVKKSEAIRRIKARESVLKINSKKAEKLDEKVKKNNVNNAGRRIVDTALLGKSMWCNDCKIPLSFCNVEKEMQRGLASIFDIRCSKCLNIIKVSSSDTVQTDSGSTLFAVNCKAAAGCIDSGIGHEQLKVMLSAMNLPIIHHNTMKRAEAQIGPAFEQSAQASCVKAIVEERKLTLAAERDVNNSGEKEPMHANNDAEVGIVCEFDFGWDKRGNGFTYDSKSGRGSVVGHKTKKILAWGAMSSKCRMCDRGHAQENHDCRKNHQGSAKSMEPASAVNLLVNNTNFKEGKVRVDVLVGDEDASTICHVQQAANHNVEKWIDTNHTVKKFSNKLYTASKKHKFLNASVIKYLKKCFCYCIARNIGNSNGLKNGLRNIAKHTFGQHDICGEWCKAQNNPGYIFQRLPQGKPFSSKTWKDDFVQILESYVEKAEKISPGGSSQRNESFNHMVVTRAPKSRSYGSTPALSYRVAAAALQKNEGADYMTEVSRRAGLSPGKVTQKYRQMMQSKREKKAERQLTIKFKRRRLFLKNNSGTQQRKEGLTYMSGMGPTMEKAINATCTINEFIPEFAPLQPSSKIVIVDTETTGFGSNADIVHIAAKCGAQSFEAYMIPQQPIHPKASEITGFSVDNGYLLYFKQRVESTPSATAAKDFVNFLCRLDSQILIVGHNVIKFDAPLIFRWLEKHNFVEKMCSITYGLTDTIPLLRQGKVSKQDVLAKQYLTSPEWNSFHETAHNTLTDCYLLNGLLEHFKISDEVLESKALSLKEFFERQAMLRRQKTQLPSLLPLESAVSRTMLNKMARQGVTMEELVREFQLHGNKGIEVSLGVRVNGKPRITTNKRIVENVIEGVKNSLAKHGTN